MVNQVGGNDSLVFDGSSLVIAPDGRVVAQGKSFEEDLILFDSKNLTGEMHAQIAGEEASAYEALVLGTRDYVHKCGFQRAIIGLSGGIDSALTACVAVDALGAANVIGVGMPGPYSSRGSIDDARALAANLGIRFELLSIDGIYRATTETLAPAFAGLPADVTEENIQSRARGLLLMSLSNKLGALVLSTGNKSELAAGYCTLYGDMVGGLAVISDVPKTLVYRLSAYVNSRRRQRSTSFRRTSDIDKPPSAELRPDQKDSDSLPPYDVLDSIVEDYVEESRSAEQIVHDRGYDPEFGQACDRNDRAQRVQAPAGRTRNQNHTQGVRIRATLSDCSEDRVRTKSQPPADGLLAGCRIHPKCRPEQESMHLQTPRPEYSGKIGLRQGLMRV